MSIALSPLSYLRIGAKKPPGKPAGKALRLSLWTGLRVRHPECGSNPGVTMAQMPYVYPPNALREIPRTARKVGPGRVLSPRTAPPCSLGLGRAGVRHRVGCCSAAGLARGACVLRSARRGAPVRSATRPPAGPRDVVREYCRLSERSGDRSRPSDRAKHGRGHSARMLREPQGRRPARVAPPPARGPMTRLQNGEKWWCAQRDSNPRPSDS